MFVTKVDKNTIQVRFFETDDKDPHGNVVWEANGHFTPSDVHHQYGIVLKTPAYRNQQIGI
jgi:Rel/ankyrin family protein